MNQPIQNPPVRLSELKPGQGARISNLSPEIHAERAVRLQELGILPGTDIEVLGRGFGGEPLAIQISHARIAVGKEDAIHIHVHLQ